MTAGRRSSGGIFETLSKTARILKIFKKWLHFTMKQCTIFKTKTNVRPTKTFWAEGKKKTEK